MHEAQALLTRLLSLTEAGRVLSSKSLAAIRAALDALNALVTQAEGSQQDPTKAAGSDAKATESAVALAETALALVEAELSHNDTQAALRAAVQAGGAGRWAWVRDVFDTWFVYEDSGQEEGSPSRLFKRTYVVADDGTVTLGAPTEVRVRTVYDPVGAATREAADVVLTGDLVPLVEKAVRRDNTVAVKLIQPGWGSSGYYGAEMLERDGPKVFTKGLKMYWDHPTATEEAERPERSLRDLAGELVGDARWDPTGPAGAGLYADAKVFGGFKEAVEELAPHIGVSIRAMGKASPGEAEGKKGPVIESIVAAKSTDFVTAPGAGGQVLSLFESARGRHPANPQPEGSQVTEEEARALREANTAAVGRIAQLEARLIESDAREIVRRELGGAPLPPAAISRLASTLVASPPLTEGALDAEALVARVKEAVTAEQAYIASLGGSGAIRGMGAAAPAGEATAEASGAALERSFVLLGMSESAAKIAAGGRS